MFVKVRTSLLNINLHYTRHVTKGAATVRSSPTYWSFITLSSSSRDIADACCQYRV